MVLQNSLFPSLLVLILITNLTALSPISNCLGNCATCEPNNLTFCKGAASCEWGYFDSKNNGNCELLPTLKLLSSELGERVDKNMKISSQSWGDDAKYSTCEYSFQGKKKIIDILGIFDGVTTISKTFTVTPNQQIYEFSFNLIRDQWLPFNDFLVIDISSQDQPIQSIEISYESMKKIQSQSTVITCSGKRFMNEKYNVKILNTKRQIGDSLSFVFSSFLYASTWGVSNVKVIEGCAAFSKLDAKTETCSSCDNGSFLVKNTQGALWCEKCPRLCATCTSEKGCTACVTGAKLNSGICQFSEDYKTQEIQIQSKGPQCGANYLILGSLGTSAVLPSLDNTNGHLYDEIQIGFEFYYNPSEWNAKTTEKISVKVNKIQAFTLAYQNLTNTATDFCTLFKDNKVSSIRIISPSIIQVSNHLNIELQLVGKSNITFGVREVFVKSLVKYEQKKNNVKVSTSEDSEAIISGKVAVNVSNLNNLTQQVRANIITTTENPSLSASFIPKNQLNSEEQIQQVQKSNSSDSLTSSTQSNKRNSLSFIPILSQSISGLQLTIPNMTQIKGYLTVTIDKLPQSNFELENFYIDDSVLHAFLIISESFTDAVLTVSEHSKATSRLLQVNQTSKIIAKANIPRFDYISKDQSNSIASFSLFFNFFAWFGVISIIIAVMIGYGVTVQEYIISLQILFLHVYIAVDILPLSFREVVAGLRVIQNLNFFVPSQAKSIEGQWMGNVVQNGPVRLSLYNTDINFSRQFYPILVINIIYFIWFCLLFLAKRYLLKSIPFFQEKGLLNRIIENITKRVINFSDQIWRYQFLATVWFCFLQFHNLAYPGHSNRSQIMNSIFCISCFICTLAWPIIIGYFARRQYYEHQYSEFIYKFQDIFFMKIPQFYLPTSHHRVGYPLFRIGKCFAVPFLIAYIDNPPFVLLMLITIQVSELIYTQNYDIFSDHKYAKLKIVENSLFCVMEVVMLILYGTQSFANTTTYIGLGFFLSVIGLMIVLNSCARVGFLGFKKYKEITGVFIEEMVDPDVNKLKTERIV